jgi:Gram-negative bacterial TonB protein C-terminal
MPRFPAVLIFSLALVVATSSLSAQDMPIRVEAIRLLERANSVSRPSHMMPNHRIDQTFRAYRLDGSIQDGTANTIISGDIERYELVFGSYHPISIHYPNKIVQNAEYQPTPPETHELDALTPLRIGRFDHSDTINFIIPATVSGRSAKCIHFDTVNGRTHQSNEICVDDELGFLLRWHVAEDFIEDTDYVSFESMWLPTHIRHYINGRLRMDVEQKFTVIDGPIDWPSLTPPDPATLTSCKQYRRPIIQLAPQPRDAGPGPWFDVQVHGVIGEDGRVREPSVLPAGRDDLEKRSLQIVSSWIFSPGLCNGEPIPVIGNFVVHFPPQ